MGLDGRRGQRRGRNGDTGTVGKSYLSFLLWIDGRQVLSIPVPWAWGGGVRRQRGGYQKSGDRPAGTVLFARFLRVQVSGEGGLKVWRVTDPDRSVPFIRTAAKLEGGP